jgi:TolB-like protein
VRPVDVKALDKELGVRYVLKGSVERFGNGVDTNVKLIGISTGAVVWGDLPGLKIESASLPHGGQ